MSTDMKSSIIMMKLLVFTLKLTIMNITTNCDDLNDTDDLSYLLSEEISRVLSELSKKTNVPVRYSLRAVFNRNSSEQCDKLADSISVNTTNNKLIDYVKDYARHYHDLVEGKTDE